VKGEKLIKAIIFDLDGVIVHTDQFHYLAWKKIADELGLHFDAEMNNLLRGVSRMDSLEIILNQNHCRLSGQEKASLAEKKNNMYQASILTMTPADVSPDVLWTLREAKAKGLKIAIGSSSKNTKTILKQTGLSEMFDAVSDGEKITRTKPDPEVFLKAAEYLGIDPLECAIVEDADAGVQAGKNAGMVTMAIGNATLSGSADHQLRQLSDLFQWITAPNQ